MKLLIDVNLSPKWVPALAEHGISARHWTNLGACDAPDTEIMAWAREHDHIVFTHDLDFGTLLALTYAKGPSVIQVRTQDILPASLAQTVVTALREFEEDLAAGALLTIDETKLRIRLLPLRRDITED